MTRSAFLAVPWLMLAGVARAQTPATEPAPPPPPLVDAEEPSTATKQVKLPSGTVVTVPADSPLAQEPAEASTQAPRQEPAMPWSARLLIEGLGGTLGAGVGMYAGALVGTSDPSSAAFIMVGGGLIGIGVGVLTTGSLLHTDGSGTHAIIGEALGGLAGVALALVGWREPLLLLAAGVAPIAGAVIGLEVIGRDFGLGAPPPPAEGMSLRTMLVPVKGGAVLAFGGRL